MKAASDRVPLSPNQRGSIQNIKFVRGLNQVSFHAFQRQNAMEETMCDYSLETYRSRPAQLGEKYETHRFPSFSIGFIAPCDPSTAVCMACDTKLRLEGIPEKLQKAYFVTRNEDVTFTRLEDGPHHDGVRFGNGAEVTLQQLGTGVQGWVYDALSAPLEVRETAEVL
jgi:hypothetical protein